MYSYDTNKHNPPPRATEWLASKDRTRCLNFKIADSLLLSKKKKSEWGVTRFPSSASGTEPVLE